MAKQQKLLSPSAFKTSSFIAEGFGSWNKALERFDMHEKSEMHGEAVERLAYKSSRVNIGNTGTDPEINQWGGWLMFHVGSLIYVVIMSIIIAAIFKDRKWGFSRVLA